MDHILLRNKNARLIIFGNFISLMGSKMQSFALSLYVLSLTGSATKFASVLAVTVLPTILIGPFVGVVVDWFNQKKMVIWLDLISGFLVLLVAAFYCLTGVIPLSLIYVTVFILSLISCAFSPAMQSMIPKVIEREDRFEVNSIQVLCSNTASIISTLAAGAIMGFKGIGIILFINAVSFFVSAFSERFIDYSEVDKGTKPLNANQFFEDFKEGFQLIVGTKTILIAALLAGVINFIFNPIFSVGLTYLIKVTYHYSDFEFGIMSAIATGGFVLGPLFAGKVIKKLSLIQITTYGLLMCGCLTALIGLVPGEISVMGLVIKPFISITLLVFCVAVAVVLSNIGVQTQFQNAVPKEMMGRASAFMASFVMCLTPIGQILVGQLTETIGIHLVIIVGGIIIGLSSCVYYIASMSKTSSPQKVATD